MADKKPADNPFLKYFKTLDDYDYDYNTLNDLAEDTMTELKENQVSSKQAQHRHVQPRKRDK